MTNQIISTDTSKSLFLGKSGDSISILQGVTLSVPSTFSGILSFSTENKNLIFIDGAIVAGTGLSLSGTSVAGDKSSVGQHTISIGKSGSIQAIETIGAWVAGSDNTFKIFGSITALEQGIRNFGDRVDIFNSGSISSLTDAGVSLRGTKASEISKIVNTGEISGYSNGIVANKMGLVLVNQGTISSIKDNSGAVTVSSTNGATITNYGLISGSKSISLSKGSDTVVNHGFLDGDVNLAGGNNILTNTSTINGNVNFDHGFNALINSGAVFGDISSGNNLDRLQNSGVIWGDIDLKNSDDTFANSGSINGSLKLGRGEDIFTNIGGTVSGNVAGGEGDDTYIVDTAQIKLVEFSGEGTDTVMSSVNFKIERNIENLVLTGVDDIRGVGNIGHNTITGNAGDNKLNGFWGNDVLKGDLGDDALRGGLGNDKLEGSYGDDVLRGGSGDDKLFGGTQDDRLIGGRGADELTGGLGNDIFVFRNVEESPDSKGNRDQILDFEQGVDLIDLSSVILSPALGVPGLFFIDASPFTGAGREIRVEAGRANTSIEIDLDGDMVADMAIVLTGTFQMMEQDFIL